VTLLEQDAAIRPFTVRTIAYGMDLDKLQPDVVAWPWGFSRISSG